MDPVIVFFVRIVASILLIAAVGGFICIWHDWSIKR